ncbi:MAG: methyltransferase domain-containing protein [Rhizobiales bacterium]|nr:methyltransferase domain-containing protein [Hyphomicrobiales bacterium]
MNEADWGRYPIERRTGEIERLHLQGAAIAPDTAIMLDRIGVGPGWQCLDLGCGPRGITDLLSERVGASGRVVGLDADSAFLHYARARAPANVEFVEGNAYETGLPGGGFDFVHSRFVASTAGHPERLLAEAARLTRPGGIVALQEPDIDTFRCFPPLPAWDRLKSAIEMVFTAIGGDVHLAHRLYPLMRHAGIEDVQFRPFFLGVRAGDPMAEFLPWTIESLRKPMVEGGFMQPSEIDAAVAQCCAHLAHPDTIFTTYTVAQVWGRVPVRPGN